MDTFAALALATDPPASSILDRKPDPRSTPLITLTMWKMIIGQSVYQLAVTLTLNFAGDRILGYWIDNEKSNLETLIFNVYVWMQFFNQYNNRRLDNKFNIFEGIHRNWFFIAINLIIISGQVIIVFVGGEALSTEPLNGAQWGISLVLGAMSIVVGVVVRLIPDELIQKLILNAFQRNQAPYIKIGSDTRFKWNDTIENVRDELAFFKAIRGRRFNGFFTSPESPRTFIPISRGHVASQLSKTQRLARGRPGPSLSRSITRSRSTSALGPATVMAGVIAGSIAGWGPRELDTADDSLSNVPRVA